MKLRNYLLGILLSLGISASAQTLTKVWSTTNGLKTPESALFDSKSNLIYVSNIDGDASTKDGNGFISVLDVNGKIKTLKWVTGLNAPKGQAIYGANLYVADIDELVIISIKDAKINQRIKVENAKFLNDVTVGEDGTVFVSDMKDNKIYAYVNGKLNLWSESKQINNPNGLWAEKGKLYIGTTQILEADIKSKEIKVLVDNCGGIVALKKWKTVNSYTPTGKVAFLSQKVGSQLNYWIQLANKIRQILIIYQGKAWCWYLHSWPTAWMPTS